jgi:ABC-type phosphate transport system substrate-binding protein
VTRSRRVGAAVAVAIAGTSLALLGVTAPAGAAAAHHAAFSKTETIKRVNLVGGKDHVVDKRKVTLNVSTTQNLRGRQEIGVSWSGAHPTGGVVADQNSIDAAQEEYPFVLLECRGLDSPKVKASERLSPQTCWTQDWRERYQDSLQTQFPPYRVDRYASPADRTQVVGAPDPLPDDCQFLPSPTQHWLPFVAANGHVYDGGPAGCAGMPPESQSVGGGALPSNETFGVTGLNGKGSAKFDIWTSAENASLGCTQLVRCSLVAVPIMGVSCDVAGASLPAADQPSPAEAKRATKLCQAKGAFAPGQLVTPQGQEDLAVSGALWWSASNWRNRISVPLTFAVPSNACDVVSNGNTVDVYGSELLIQATAQWAPHFCLNPKLFKFTHVQTGEPEARNLLATGSAEAAFTSDPPPAGYGKPVVNAPVALSGFAISYAIDDANGQPYTKLRLTPELLAKLLTESYPAELPVQEEDPALAHNPLNITLDPEFQKLNPGITKGVSATESAAALLTLSSDSDVTQALTTYINDDPTARSWLNGKPDQWGMIVNPAYKKIKLPVDRWPLLSKFEPTQWYDSDTNDCLHNSPVPFLPLVAAPMARLEEISESLQFSVAASTTQCKQIDGTTLGEKLVPLGRQTSGYRFMIGVTSVPDAERYQLDTAALQTTNGHTFVSPTQASMRVAAGLLRPDTTTGTWPVPYDKLVTDSRARTAYPGTMVVYAAIPTQGLPATDAQDYADLLTFAAGAGQRPGLGVGRLPPGYLPLTTSNGLGQLAGYTAAAAEAVAAQKGGLPSLTGNQQPGPTTSPTPTPTTTSTSTSGSDGTPTTSPTTPGSLPSATNPSPSPSPNASGPVVAQPTTSAAASLGKTLGISLGGGGVVVVLVLGLSVLGGVGAPATYLIGRRRGRW